MLNEMSNGLGAACAEISHCGSTDGPPMRTLILTSTSTPLISRFTIDSTFHSSFSFSILPSLVAAPANSFILLHRVIPDRLVCREISNSTFSYYCFVCVCFFIIIIILFIGLHCQLYAYLVDTIWRESAGKTIWTIIIIIKMPFEATVFGFVCASATDSIILFIRSAHL